MRKRINYRYGTGLNSNLIQGTDRDGRVRDFTVDNLNRETTEKWMSSSTVVNTIARESKRVRTILQIVLTRFALHADL